MERRDVPRAGDDGLTKEGFEPLLLLTLLRDKVFNTLGETLGSQRDQYNILDELERLESAWSACLVFLAERFSRHTQQSISTNLSWPPPHWSISESWTIPSKDILSHGSEISETVCLLVLYPSESKSAAIWCAVGKESLEKCHKRFEVLSYTPDSSSKVGQIKHVQNKEVANVEVSASLELALRHLRHSTEPRIFWIGTLFAESGSPAREIRRIVDNMRQIYALAKRVVIWLGSETNTSGQAFKFLEALESFHPRADGLREGLFHVPSLQPSWEAVLKLLQRPWWDYAWVLLDLMQDCEVTVQCGNLSADWKTFSELFRLVCEEGSLIVKNPVLYPKACGHLLLRIPRGIHVLSLEEEESPLFIDLLSREVSRILREEQSNTSRVLATAEVAANMGILLDQLSLKLSGRHIRRCQAEMLKVPGDHGRVHATSPKRDATLLRQFQEATKNSNKLSPLILSREAVTMLVNNYNESIEDEPDGSTGPQSADPDRTKREALQILEEATNGKDLDGLIRSLDLRTEGKEHMATGEWCDDSESLQCWLQVLRAISSSPKAKQDLNWYPTGRPSEQVESQPNPTDDNGKPNGGESYSYEALSTTRKEFRMLLLHPNNTPDSEIHCDLIHADFAILASMTVKRLPFTALSYVWNDSSDSYPWTVSGPPRIYMHGRKMEVTANLFAALRRIRDPNLPALLWVDALCIDQSNVDERSRQVLFMQSIYRDARQVLMWIDEEDAETWHALIPLCLYDYAHLIEKHRSRFSPKFRQWYGTLRGHVCSAVSATHALAFDKLLSRRYWTRVWIVQEVLLAQNAIFCCGSWSVSWEAVMATLGQYGIIRSLTGLRYVGDTKPLATQLAQKYAVGPEEVSLLDAILLGRDRLATQQHDYIYAFLGLTNYGSDSIVPDYKKSAKAVFEDAFRLILHQSQNLDVLSFCRKHKSNEGFEKALSEQWPSWLPNWAVKHSGGWPHTMSVLLTEWGRRGYNATGNSQLAPVVSIDGPVLTVKGTLVDIVFYVSSSPWPSSARDNWLLYQSLWDDGWIQQSRTPRELQLDFANTSFLGQFFSSGKSRISKSEERDLIALAEIGLHMGLKIAVKGPSQENGPEGSSSKAAVKEEPSDPTTEDNGDGIYDPGMTAALDNEELGSDIRRRECLSYESSFFVTYRGRIGRGPLTMQTGDLVCIFQGAKVPFILRKQLPPPKFCIVGDAYVHGIMKGEALGVEGAEAVELELV